MTAEVRPFSPPAGTPSPSPCGCDGEPRPAHLLAYALRQLADAVKPEVDEVAGRYENIPADPEHFIELICQARKLTSGRSFIDIGCGIGTKLAIACAIGLEVAGLDFRPEYLELAGRVAPGAELLLGDAEAFDGYDRFDVVYSFQILTEFEPLEALEHLYAERIAPGAVLVLLGRWDAELPELERLAPEIWRKR